MERCPYLALCPCYYVRGRACSAGTRTSAARPRAFSTERAIDLCLSVSDAAVNRKPEMGRQGDQGFVPSGKIKCLFVTVMRAKGSLSFCFLLEFWYLAYTYSTGSLSKAFSMSVCTTPATSSVLCASPGPSDALVINVKRKYHTYKFLCVGRGSRVPCYQHQNAPIKN
jgi:hypothetical protein